MRKQILEAMLATVLAVGIPNCLEAQIAGGGARQKNERAVQSETINLGTWTRKADMPSARAGLGIGVIGDKLYAVGGTDTTVGICNIAHVKFLQTLEVYDPKTDKWERKADMPSARIDSGVGVINNELYVVGGFDNKNAKFQTLEVYDPKTDKWERKADMPSARAYLGVGVIGDKLYAVGGFDVENAKFLQILEVYDPKTDK